MRCLVGFLVVILTLAAPTHATAGPRDGALLVILDTGLDLAAPFATALYAWRDFVGDAEGTLQAAAYDDIGHGTAVTSVAIRDGATRIAAGKVLSAAGHDDFETIAARIQWASAIGARVKLSPTRGAGPSPENLATAARHAGQRARVAR